MTTFTESILAPLGHGVVRAPAEATVLVIDDDPAMRDILTTVAQQHGFGLQFAEDGAEGLRLAEQSDVDLILLDLSLPGMPGLDVCRRLRGAGVEVPIIILSASTDTVDVVVALAAVGVLRPAWVTASMTTRTSDPHVDRYMSWERS